MDKIAKDRQVDFTAELRRLQSKLRLGHWGVQVEFVETQLEAWAETVRHKQMNEAVLETGLDLLDRDWPYQRMIIIHELLHLHTRDLIAGFEMMLGSLDLSPQWQAHAIKVIELQEELLVDRLARALEPLL